METGGIPPPTLPHAGSVIQQKCRWTSSWARGNLLLLSEGRATFGKPLLPTLFYEHWGASSHWLGFVPWEHPQSMPSHQDTSLNTTYGFSSRESSLLGHKILHPGAREHIPKVQRTPALPRDAKNPRQDYQNSCGTKIFLFWKLSPIPSACRLLHCSPLAGRGTDL